MFEKMDELVHRYEELGMRLNDPSTIADQASWQKIMKEHAQLGPLVTTYLDYKTEQQAVEDNQALLQEESDEDMKELIREDLIRAKDEVARLEESLRIQLLPKDPNDDKNVFVEIRGGAGGDEAALFAADLFRMYSRYAERRNWRVEVMSVNENGLGGFKEIVFMVQGQGAYSRLKYESGVHRVQRVPATESGGRIHTSTATVAVLPEVEEVDVSIDPNDIRVDVFRASGNGGQCVNTTDSAVRITHFPTGIVVSCQDEKSQLRNKEKAMQVLRARLYELEQKKRDDAVSQERRSQVGTGDRSEKIRTYNFPQSRVTDHRIKYTSHRLFDLLDGDLDELLDTIITVDQTERLKAAEQEAS